MNQKYKIPYVNFNLQWQKEKKDLLPIIKNIFKKGQFVGGDEIEILEKKNIEIYKFKICSIFK